MSELMRSLHRRNTVTSLLAAAMLVLVAHSGAAQRDEDPYAQWQPILLPGEFEQIVDRLEFRNPDGEEICRFFYDQFRINFEKRVDAAQARFREQRRAREKWLQLHPGEEVPEHFDSRLTWTAWLAEREQLDIEFLEQVDALMEPHQMAVWRATTRSMRRKRLLQDASTSFVRRVYDLKAVIEGLGIDTNRDPILAEAVASYEDQIDAALRVFRRRYDEPYQPLRSGKAKEYEEDSTAQLDFIYDVYREMMHVRFSIEDVTRTHLNPLAGALGDDGAAFRDAAYTLIYPQVFRESPVERLAPRLQEIEGETNRGNELTAILAEYDAAQRALRYMIIGAWDRWDSSKTWDRMLDREREIHDAGTSRIPILDMYPDRDLWVRNRRLVHDTCMRLRDLFSDEEFEDLPADVRLLLSW